MSWNAAANAPWHPEAGFWTLPLEVVYVVFEWLGADIAARGYPVLLASSTGKGKRTSSEADEEGEGEPSAQRVRE